MDLSKFKTSDWLKVGGALGVLIFGFFDWVDGRAGDDRRSGGNVFDFFFTGTIPWILVVGAGVITVLLVDGHASSATALPWPLIMLAATALGALLAADPAASSTRSTAWTHRAPAASVGRGIGLILSTIVRHRCAGRRVPRLQGVGRRPERSERHQQAQEPVRRHRWRPASPPPPPPGGDAAPAAAPAAGR